MSAPEPMHPLAAIAMPGLRGAAGPQSLRVSLPRRDIVQLMVRRGADAAFAAAMVQAFGTAPPAPSHATTGGAVTIIWVQPGAYLLTAAEPGLADRAAVAFAGLAAVEDQSHGRTTITIAGPPAREVLARGCRIDLHPRVFGPGRAASTTIAQIGCLLHQTDDAPSFDLTVFSTLAEPFFHWLLEAGAGSGLVIS
ncbi:sarcosine oxidase subunit gamma family protein [Roseomonas sp. CAU 1739]|uniref:sarcosine oxidase subunit gamma n=1 Tax=Roseomonas sp. CAU 1739 TaxID=3140364 RepID=UPI00325B1196